MNNSAAIKALTIYVTIGALACGIAGYFISGSPGRNTGTLIGAIAGCIYAVRTQKKKNPEQDS